MFVSWLVCVSECFLFVSLMAFLVTSNNRQSLYVSGSSRVRPYMYKVSCSYTSQLYQGCHKSGKVFLCFSFFLMFVPGNSWALVKVKEFCIFRRLWVLIASVLLWAMEIIFCRRNKSKVNNLKHILAPFSLSSAALFRFKGLTSFSNACGKKDRFFFALRLHQ